ncbi:LPD29 domain-containing protein [Streptomyces sp. NPDC101213]|uniref:LPD29 domain-containing protein n=1 Tax=Streptomyces sp. NPDC101213 TaxID=3366130 RepID=UPI003813EB93
MENGNSAKARAARLRAALNEAFDGHRFSVTSINRGRHSGWITIRWEDGPTEAAVRRIAAPHSLQGRAIDTQRTFGADTGKQLDALWNAAETEVTKPGTGIFRAWQHEGRTVPEGTPWDQRTWLADHVVLPAQGQGTAMDPAAEPEPEHERPAPAEPASEAAQRRTTALALLTAMAGHVRTLPESWWEPATDTDQTCRLGTLVGGAVLAELSGLTSALAHLARVSDPAKRQSAHGLLTDTIDRLVTANNPVLRQVAPLMKDNGK